MRMRVTHDAGAFGCHDERACHMTGEFLLVFNRESGGFWWWWCWWWWWWHRDSRRSGRCCYGHTYMYIVIVREG